MNIENEMIEAVLKNPDPYLADFLNVKKRVLVSDAVYKGEPVPYLYIPKVYMPEDIRAFQIALSGMFDIVNRSIELYLTEPAISNLFGFDERLDALIRLKHHYDVNVPMGRFDLFYYGPGRFQFCELNTDGTSAMIEQKALAEILIESRLMKDFCRRYAFKAHELFYSWVDAVGIIYGQFRKNTNIACDTKDKTTVAIVDFIDKSSPLEFNEFARAFQSRGYECLIADPREIESSNGYMTYRGKSLDIVYRRLVTKDLMEHYDEIPGFINGLYGKKACIIGSIKTQIVHSKRFFQVLYDPLFRSYLTQKQIAFIDEHIPFTKKLRLSDTNNDAYTKGRSDYIIKPVDYYASKGVHAGSEYTAEEWVKLLTEKSREDYIIQSYAPLSPVDNIILNENDEFESKRFNTITGLFVYNERLSGIYVRGGVSAIISGLHNGYTFASFAAE